MPCVSPGAAVSLACAARAKAIIRITGGNFRLLHRLCTEIQRILQINELRTVTKEVVETARETLVIGLGI
jgi:hypothetical protein